MKTQIKVKLWVVILGILCLGIILYRRMPAPPADFKTASAEFIEAARAGNAQRVYALMLPSEREAMALTESQVSAVLASIVTPALRKLPREVREHLISNQDGMGASFVREYRGTKGQLTSVAVYPLITPEGPRFALADLIWSAWDVEEAVRSGKTTTRTRMPIAVRHGIARSEAVLRANGFVLLFLGGDTESPQTLDHVKRMTASKRPESNRHR